MSYSVLQIMFPTFSPFCTGFLHTRTLRNGGVVGLSPLRDERIAIKGEDCQGVANSFSVMGQYSRINVIWFVSSGLVTDYRRDRGRDK